MHPSTPLCLILSDVGSDEDEPEGGVVVQTQKLTKVAADMSQLVNRKRFVKVIIAFNHLYFWGLVVHHLWD